MCIAFLGVWLFAGVEANAQDFGNLARYAEQNKELQQLGKKEKRVVFMGNSITEGWVNQRPDFFRANNYVGRGISGQSSYQFLVRFREDVINLLPDLVVINAGTNDVAENTMAYNEDYTFGNIVSMVEMAQANKIKVILTSTLPASSFGWNPKIRDAAVKIASLNDRIRAYAKKHRIPYVDYYEKMVFGEEKALNPAYTNDGVHPTVEGYVVMEQLIKKAIEKEL
ncbi:MAG: SGNH/GDSL hydrolase family protein [Bacteroidales bacterium]|nr:SGNH/GDSL hydrolase family protein [Bacteroidales bacterium]